MATYESNVDKVIKELTKKQERALEKAGLFVLGEVQTTVPVDTGNLRSSYNMQREDKTVYVGTNVDYAQKVEFGTGGISALQGGMMSSNPRARPHLRPAFSKNQNSIKKIIQQELAK